jgi:SAM-dependent methyltransferase
MAGLAGRVTSRVIYPGPVSRMSTSQSARWPRQRDLLISYVCHFAGPPFLRTRRAAVSIRPRRAEGGAGEALVAWRHIAPIARALDIGCGTGRVTEALLELVPRVSSLAFDGSARDRGASAQTARGAGRCRDTLTARDDIARWTGKVGEPA